MEVEFGLSSGEVVRRRDRDGPNRLAEIPPEGWWRAFLRQFQILMIVVLLVAAAVSLVVTRQWETPVFTTTDLALVQWLACAAIGSTIMWIGELVKLVLRTRAARAAGSGNPLESPTAGMVDAHA